MGRQPEVRAPGASYTVRVRGAQAAWFDNAYHAFLRASWPVALGAIVATFLLSNTLFATAYVLVGGVANMPAGSWRSAFFFSVQTLATIGYGGMSPTSDAANVVVVVEAVYGLLFTALSTGAVFAKFSQPRARIAFSKFVCVTQHEGKPTLMLRIGNARGNRVLEANVRLDLSVTRRTQEGRTFYSMSELTPVRARIPALSRSFSVMHVIDSSSPLHGMTMEDVVRAEVELLVTITGLDDTTGQTMHGQELYESDRIRVGHHPADMLSEEEGQLVLDVAKFHEVEPD